MAALKKCLGVDLGSNTVKVVEVAVEKKRIRVLRAASAETGVEPSAGAEDRRAAIIRTFKALVKKERIGTKAAIFALPGQKVFIRRFRLPSASEERLEKIVAFEARQQIPFPIEKTDLQWQFFPVPEEDEVEVLLVAVRHDEVRDFMGLASRTGLKIDSIGVTSFALFNTATTLGRSPEQLQKLIDEKGPQQRKSPALKAIKKGKKKAKKGKEAAEEDHVEELQEEASPDDFAFQEVKGFVNIGASAMDLVIALQGPTPLMKFARSVPQAGNEVTRAVMQATGVQDFADAERIKKHQTRVQTFAFEAEPDPNVNEDASAAATQALDRIISELRRSLDFFISQPDGMAVDSLVISGGQALMPGLADYIEEKLTIPVTLADSVPDDLPIEWPGDSPLSEFSIALGLGLQGLGFGGVAVDFLPAERKITRDFPYKRTGAMAALLAGAVFFSTQAGDEFVQEYQTEAQAIQARAASNRPRLSAQQNVQQRHDEVATKFDEMRKGVGQRSYWMEKIAALTEAKPADVLILRLYGGHEGFIRIEGAAESERSVADFSNALAETLEEPEQSPEIIASRQVDGAQVGMPDQNRVFRFLIELETSDKLNRLELTPTPDPEALERQGRMGMPGMPGMMYPGMENAPRRRGAK